MQVLVLCFSVVIFRGEKLKCVLEINIGNNTEIKVKGSFVVGLISVRSEFLDAVVTLHHSQCRWRIL